jgi:uncharacterized membrane-anchored protein
LTPIGRRRWLGAATLLMLLAGVVHADENAASREAALEAANEAAHNAILPGPTSITLKDQATLALPEGFGFIPKKEAAELMRLLGNQSDDRFLGLVVPLDHSDGAHWYVWMDYEPAGYVKDDDAKHWKSDELLQSLKDGTEANNVKRTELGLPALMVTRWIEPPTYESARHQLVWSAEVTRKDGSSKDPSVNYNTYVLGRDGYLSLNLITGASRIDTDKLAAHRLLEQVSYKAGKNYGDFNSSTDKVAAYGLAALVAGVAAKKLGLLAVLAAAAVKFAKVIAIAVAGVGAAVVKWFKGRSKPNAGPPGGPSA